MIQRIVAGIVSVFFGFPANGWTNPEVFQPKAIRIPRKIFPQNFSSLGLTVLEELGNKQTEKLTVLMFLLIAKEIQLKFQQKTSTSSFLVDKTALITLFGYFQDHFQLFSHFISSLKWNRIFMYFFEIDLFSCVLV